MLVELNVGHDALGQKDALTHNVVLSALITAGLSINASVELSAEGKRERTSWVRLRVPSAGTHYMQQALHYIADFLDQHCIAVLYEDGTGELIGSRAAEWGDFNPAYFVRSDGRPAARKVEVLR